MIVAYFNTACRPVIPEKVDSPPVIDCYAPLSVAVAGLNVKSKEEKAEGNSSGVDQIEGCNSSVIRVSSCRPMLAVFHPSTPILLRDPAATDRAFS